MRRFVRGRVILAASAVVALLATCTTTQQFLCEEAAARLARCCPGFDPRVLSCDEVAAAGGGCRSGRDPRGLFSDEASCILGVACTQLSSVCSRVAARAACTTNVCTTSDDCPISCPFQPSSCLNLTICSVGRCVACVTDKDCCTGFRCVAEAQCIAKDDPNDCTVRQNCSPIGPPCSAASVRVCP